MNKQFLIICIIVLIINLGFSGCFEENKKQDYLSKFIGTWRLVESSFVGYPYGLDNHTEETWIFYENKSVKITSIHFKEYPEEPNASININWIQFNITEGIIALNTEEGSIMWFKYNFSNNDTQLTLSIPRNMTQKLKKIE